MFYLSQPVHYTFLPQPCIIRLSTELHQEFQGQTNRQTSVLPESNDEPLPHGRTRLRLRLPSAPHGSQRTPSSHLRRGDMNTCTPNHTHNHTRLLQTSLSQFGIENLTLMCRPNRTSLCPSKVVSPTLVFSSQTCYKLYLFGQFGPVLFFMNVETQKQNLFVWMEQELNGQISNMSHHIMYLTSNLLFCCFGLKEITDLSDGELMEISLLNIWFKS